LMDDSLGSAQLELIIDQQYFHVNTSRSQCASFD
jgi:hypothetical protein